MRTKKTKAIKLERSIPVVFKIWASSLPEEQMELDWIYCSRMTGVSIPSPDAWAEFASREALKSFPISVSVVARGRIGTHLVGTAGISVGMAGG